MNRSTSSGPDAAASLLERARSARDDLAARMYLAAAVEQAAIAVGAHAILTGGTAVDFYASRALGTSAAYPLKWRPSADVDVVVMAFSGWEDAQPDLLRQLERLGMRPQWTGDRARVVEVPGLDYVLEIVGRELNRDPKAERVFTVLLDGRWPVPLRGPEDVILSYAESGWDTRHSADWERALAVFQAMRDKLDLAFYYAEADRRRQRHVADKVARQEPLRP